MSVFHGRTAKGFEHILRPVHSILGHEREFSVLNIHCGNKRFVFLTKESFGKSTKGGKCKGAQNAKTAMALGSEIIYFHRNETTSFKVFLFKYF